MGLSGAGRAITMGAIWIADPALPSGAVSMSAIAKDPPAVHSGACHFGGAAFRG